MTQVLDSGTDPAGGGPVEGSADPPVSSVRFARRVAGTLGHQAVEALRSVTMRVPAASARMDRPRTQPLRSSSVRMFRWGEAPYGTDAKPASLEDIPWEYIRENEDDIPFLGLREYWYPALKSEELRNNVSKPLTMLGDNLVFFRDERSRAVALENRCPHRSALLSLGQVGVASPGTITCRYHGLTLDGGGQCVAYLGDGPDSPALGKVSIRSYPVEEHGGIVWVWMGDEAPRESALQTQPHLESVLAQSSLIVQNMQLNYNHLNMLDNATDLIHVGVLHRTCLLFGDQAPFGEIKAEVGEDGGLHASYKVAGQHPGDLSIDTIDWYLPNVVYHAPGDVGAGLAEGMLWFVPRDIGSFTVWMMMGQEVSSNPLRRFVETRLSATMVRSLFRQSLGPSTLISCLLAGDAPIQQSQGRVVRWDLDRLTRGDKAVTQARRMMQAAHREEVKARRERAAT